MSKNVNNDVSKDPPIYPRSEPEELAEHCMMGRKMSL